MKLSNYIWLLGRQLKTQYLLKTISVLLMFSLLTVSTPAAPRIIVNGANSFSQDVRFAFLSSNLAINFPNWFAAFFAKTRSSNSSTNISYIEIFPGSVTVNQGEQITFSAVGYDSEDVPINGIDFSWSIADTGRNLAARPLLDGKFEAQVIGTFTVTVEGDGQQTQTTIVVNPSVAGSPNQQSLREISPIRVSPRSPQITKEEESKNSDKDKQDSPEEGENLLPDEGVWNNGNWSSSDDPENLPGNPPGHPADDGAGNGNFQLSAPIISLPGRGIDLALNLNYNSRLWNKSGNELTFDIDRGFPAPGWSLGFGKIMDLGSNGGSMLIDADGTRHGFSGDLHPGSNGTSTFVGRTADGNFIDYKSFRDSNGIYLAYVWLPNGTTIGYGAKANGAVYPTWMVDAQGNTITITYRSNQGPALQTVTDTVGRVITFQYDSSNRLISATAPRMQNEDPIYGSGKTRTLFKLHYRNLSLSHSFASGITAMVRNNPVSVIDSIYYPSTNTGYWFGGADSNHPNYSGYYSSYGMLTKVEEQRGMSWTANAEEQGEIISGQMSKRAIYNYPLTPINETGRTNGIGLTNAPIYTKLTESWDGRDVNEDAVTNYAINNNAYHWDGTTNAAAREIIVTQPNGAISKQYSYRTPNNWKDGLVFADETVIMNGSTPTVISSSLVNWQFGEYDSPRPSWAEITDENGKKVKTVYTYTGGKFNQITRSCDYGNSNNLLRCATAQYDNSTSYIGQAYSYGYTGRHIYNLMTASGIENPNGSKASWTTYEYDNYQSKPLVNTPGVIQHTATHDPDTTETTSVQGDCILYEEHPYGGQYCVDYEYYDVSVYDPATDKRGNITKTTSYSDAQGLGGAIYEERSYDITGNLRTASTACCEQTSIQYTSGTQYAYPTSQTRGSADVNSPHRITTSAVYEENTGLIKQQTDANGRTSTLMYDPNTLRPVKSISSTGAYSIFGYNDTTMTVTEEVRDAGNNQAGKSIKYLNGIGLTKREESLGENNIWDIVEMKYNKYAEEWKQSRPYRTGDTPQWSERIYDLQGRLTTVIEPDGSETKAFYNETNRPDSATTAIGDTMRVVDAWGRERWGRYDQQGRLAEVVEPNPTGNGSVSATGSLMTKYTQDTLGRLTKTEQGSQIREFKYDDLGRLTKQKLAEQTATLDVDGFRVGAGDPEAKWSEAFFYDNRSNLTQKIDARGVKTNLSYQINGVDDPLNRLQLRSYNLSGPLESNLTIHSAPNVSYTYMTSGDKSRLSQIRTDGILTENFSYDVEGRVADYTQTVDYRTSYPMTVSYLYDSLDRVTDVRYPATYGLGGNPRKLVQNNYDVTSRLKGLKVDNQEVAGNIVYNASDQTTSIKIGTAGTNQVTEQYTFDQQTGLLTNQKAIRNSQNLLDLSYDYNRNNSVGNLNGKTGHLTKIINNLDNNKNRAYEFDAVGRLTKAKGGNGGNLWTQNYSYDRYGNRTNVTASGVAANNTPIPLDGLPNLSYDTANNRINTTGFLYDSAGNQTKAKAEYGTWLKYEYDAANRIRIVKNDDGTPLQAFNYGSSNQRLMDLDYVYGYLKIFAGSVEYTEFAGNIPTWTKSYVNLGNRLLATITPNGTGGEYTDYNHPDQLGTKTITEQLTGANYEQTTLPFGTALNAESTASLSKRFTSYERSARTGLDYAINRTYDSKQGRFTQVDPIGMKAVNLEVPQTLNLYNYCGNDPINHTDPDGLFWGAIKKFFKKLLKVLQFVALVAVTILLAQTGVGLILAGGYANVFLGLGVLLGTSVFGAKIGAVVVSKVRELIYKCNVPNFAGLSKGRQGELSQLGVSADQWNNLKNKQKLGYFNVTAAIARARLSLAGWLVDWAAGGIKQDRVFFAAGVGAINLFAQVMGSSVFQRSNGHPPNNPIGFRFNSLTRSLQLSFSRDGRRIDADVDYFNPNRGAGLVGHGYEVISHFLGNIFGGTQSNPYNTRYRSSWECK